MRTRQQTTDRNHRGGRQYALCRGVGFWELTFEGRHAIFKHEQGALYVVWLLLHPPPEPLHTLALALGARSIDGQPGGADEIIQQRSLGLDDAETIRRLRRQQRKLEAVLEDQREIEPVIPACEFPGRPARWSLGIRARVTIPKPRPHTRAGVLSGACPLFNAKRDKPMYLDGLSPGRCSRVHYQIGFISVV